MDNRTTLPLEHELQPPAILSDAQLSFSKALAGILAKLWILENHNGLNPGGENVLDNSRPV